MNDQKEVSLTFKNTVTGQKELDNYEKKLTNIYSLINGLKGNSGALAKVKIELNDVTKNTKTMSTEVEKAAKKFNKSFDTAGLVAAAKAVGNLAKAMTNLTQKSVDYIENVNLLEVAYHNNNETIDESSARIENYIDKMAELYGLDESNLTRQFGVFKQMANAMQLPVETGERLSELMVKMSNDVASLYNLSLERSSNALQSALVGQTRPIRGATGADITEKTLQRTVDDLGLDKSISDLSYVEKRLIMVISLTQQLKVSQGDYARTINSASNQIRIMQEQWVSLSRAVGNIFYPILEKILPYVNAILMVLTEIANIVAGLLGFEMPEFDYSSLSGVSDMALDLEDALGDTFDNTNKGIDKTNKGLDTMKKKLSGLRNFDALNVINTPSSSSSGGTGGAGGSSGGVKGGKIDPKILDAFNKAFGDYNDMMEKVKLKANDIRDKIMEWLGFTKEVDEKTGEIKWKFDHITSGTVLGALVAGGAIFTGIKKIVGLLQTIGFLKFEHLGTLGNVLKFIAEKTGLSTVIKDIGEGFALWKGGAGTLGEVLKDVVLPSLSKLASSLAKIAPIIVAIAAYVKAFQDSKIQEKLKNVASRFADLKNTLEPFMPTIEKFAKTMGNLIFPIGAIAEGFNLVFDVLTNLAILNIGQFLSGLDTFLNVATKLVQLDIKGAFEALGQGFMDFADNYNYFFDNLLNKTNEGTNTIKSYREENERLWKEQEKLVGQVVAEQEAEIDALVEMLGTLIDSNGKVNESNRLKAQIITEELSKATGKQITLEKDQVKVDGQVIKNQQDLAKQMDILIAKQRLQLLLEADKEKYVKALKDQKKLQEDANRLHDIYNESLKDTSKEGQIVSQMYYDMWQEAKKQSDQNNQTILDYEALMAGQYGKSKEEIDKVTKAYTDGTLTMTDRTAQKATNSAATIVEGIYKNVRSKAEKEIDTWKTNLKNKNFEVKVNTVFQTVQSNLQNVANNLGKALEKTSFNQAITNVLKFLGKANGGYFKNGQWSPITNYATGGIPRVGQMFVAREAGPELVGKIGNGTAVMNNNQIVDSVSNGVYRAVISANKANGGGNSGTQVFNIYLDKNQKLATYTLEQLQEMAKTNGKPIKIGG